jgi:vanillate O-demethylase ferredoxin subunit
MELTIRKIKTQAQDIMSLELARADGQNLPAFSAGSHIDLKLGNGLTRSYSLVNDPAEQHRYVVAVNKDPNSRGGSSYVHESLRQGQTLEVSEPRNNFKLVEDASLVVMIAGGIGITPLLSMIHRLETLGRPWKLYYNAMTRAKCAYMDEVLALDARAPGRVQLYIVNENDGRFNNLDQIVSSQPTDAHLYCCGPVPMLKAFEEACAPRPPECVHVEYFSAQQAAANDGGFDVVLARGKRSIRVEAGKSILQSLLDYGIEVPHACQEGVCGACQTTVLAGTPDHRDSFLTPREKTCGKTMMLCCSGSLTPELVLDLDC